MKYFQKVIYTIFVLAISVSSIGQNNTASPYSLHGIGELANVAYGRNLALGGTGYGIRSNQYLNIKNPASLTAIDSLSFLFETGVNLKSTLSQTTSENELYTNGNLTHIIMGNRINSTFMMSMGMMPYSNVGYNLITTSPVVNSDAKAIHYWEGAGGLTKYYLSLGGLVAKGFSLGVEGSYLYGPLSQDVTTLFRSTKNLRKTNSRYSGFSLKGGVQFSTDLDDKGTNLTFGGIYSLSSILRGKSDLEIIQIYDGGIVDTTYAEKNIVAKTISIPKSYGGGFSFTLHGKYMLAADYEFNGWATNIGSNYVNRHIISGGFERKPLNSLKFFDRCSYRVGFRYDSGYIKYKSMVIDDARVSVGFGFPIQKTRSMINITLEAGQLGTLDYTRERYAKVTLGFSLHDYWFVERKFD